MNYNWHTIGHDRQKKEIESNILNNNLAHAYLFSGPKDIGKLYFTKEFVSALLCPNNFCKTCSTCRQIESLTHPDFLILDMLYIDNINTNWETISKFSNVPQDHRASGVKSKTDRIGIGTIRTLQERLQEKAYGKYKICVIHNVDRVTPEATNSFLKIVEEPPKGTIFIFTTSKESALLPTLLSRLRVVRFNALHTSLIEEKLKEKFGDLPNKKEILQYAQGRIGVAFRLAKDPELFLRTQNSYKKIREVFEKLSLRKRFAFAEEISENTEDLNEFFEHSYFYLRSKIDVGTKNIIKMIEELEKTESYIKQNVNKRLALENFFLSFES